MRRGWPCVPIVLVLAGCGGGSPQRAHRHARAPLPAAPISAHALTLGGRIVIVNGWQGVVSGQRLQVAAGRYARDGRGVALVSDGAGLEREVRAPRGEGALRILRRQGRRLAVLSGRGGRFTLGLRTLALERRPGCPQQPLKARLPKLSIREAGQTLSPLPLPHSDAFAVLLAIISGAQGNIERVDAAPARHAPCGLAARTIAAHVWITTPRPVVGILRRTVYVSRFAGGWRAWRVTS